MARRITLALAMAVASLGAQALPTRSFDTASIKPSVTPAPSSVSASGDRVVATNATLRRLIQFAYQTTAGTRLFNSQVIGAPQWGEIEPFDVQAKANADVPVTIGQLRAMTRAMLKDRFQLRTHQEMRELPVYDFVVAKGGVRIKPASDRTPPQLRGKMRTTARPSLSGAITLVISGSAITMQALIENMQQYLDRPILDSSRLDGLFDIQLEFSLAQSQPVAGDDSGGASIFTATQEQLGLKLDAVKKPIEVLVIDRRTPDPQLK